MKKPEKDRVPNTGYEWHGLTVIGGASEYKLKDSFIFIAGKGKQKKS